MINANYVRYGVKPEGSTWSDKKPLSLSMPTNTPDRRYRFVVGLHMSYSTIEQAYFVEVSTIQSLLIGYDNFMFNILLDEIL